MNRIREFAEFSDPNGVLAGHRRGYPLGILSVAIGTGNRPLAETSTTFARQRLARRLSQPKLD